MFNKKVFKEVLKDFKQEVNKDLQSEYDDQKLTKMVKKDIKLLDVFDTGLTYKESFGELLKKDYGWQIRLVTPPSVTRDGEFYPVFRYFGLGTNRKFGQRRWLEKTANKIIKDIT